MIAVLDTSAVIRIFIPDGPVPERLADLLGGAGRGDDTLIAPELMAAEAIQVLHKKREQNLLSTAEFVELSKDLLALPVRLFGHRELLARAAELAHTHRLTVYDCLFLALGEAKNASLVTADHRLERTARKLGLRTA